MGTRTANGQSHAEQSSNGVGSSPPGLEAVHRNLVGEPAATEPLGQQGRSEGQPRKRDTRSAVDELSTLTSLVAGFGDPAQRTLPFDVTAAEEWPKLWACFSCQRDTKGNPRAPGEIMIRADAAVVIVTLKMPQEGIMLATQAESLSGAFNALEGCLCMNPIPWRELDKYSAKRKKEVKKGNDKSPSNA